MNILVPDQQALSAAAPALNRSAIHHAARTAMDIRVA